MIRYRFVAVLSKCLCFYCFNVITALKMQGLTNAINRVNIQIRSLYFLKTSALNILFVTFFFILRFPQICCVLMSKCRQKWQAKKSRRAFSEILCFPNTSTRIFMSRFLWLDGQKRYRCLKSLCMLKLNKNYMLLNFFSHSLLIDL